MKGNVVVSVRVRPNGGDSSSDPDWAVDNKRSTITYKGGEGGDFRYGAYLLCRIIGQLLTDSSQTTSSRMAMTILASTTTQPSV